MAITRVAFLLAFVAIATVVLFIRFPYSPLQDLPEWIYQGFAFDQLVSGHACAGCYLKTYPVPYTVVQLFISGLLLMVNPMITSKLVVASYAVLAAWATHRIIDTYRLERAIAWPVFLSIFVLNGPFWSGYIGYQFGLVIFTLYLSLGARWRAHAAIVMLASVLAFFTHGIIFFCVVLAAAAFSFNERRLIVFSIAILPSAILALWYVHSNITSQVGGPTVVLANLKDFLGYKIYTFLKLGPYHSFSISGVQGGGRFDRIRAVAGTTVNFVFLIGVSVCALFPAGRPLRRANLWRPEIIIGVTLVCIACLLKPTAFGVGNPSERLLYPAFIALSTVAFSRRQRDNSLRTTLAKNGVSLALIAGFVLSSVGLIVAARSYDRGSPKKSVASAGTPVENSSRALFDHRMTQFDDRMKETDREWQTGDAPSLPLVFDTALLGQIH